MRSPRVVRKRCLNCTTILEPKPPGALPKGFFCDVVCARDWWGQASLISRIHLITELELDTPRHMTLVDMTQDVSGAEETPETAEEDIPEAGTLIAT